MLIALLLLAVVTSLSWLLVCWWRVRRFWAQRSVVHNPPHPLLGSFTFLQKKNTSMGFADLYRQFDTPYMGIWLFWQPALVINDMELAKRVLVKDSELWRDRFSSSSTSDPIGHLNIFMTNDPTWSWIRRRLTPVFTSSRLRGMQPLLDTKTKELVQRFRNEMAEKKVVQDIRSVYADFFTDMIGITSFGVDSSATLTGDSAIRRVTRDFETYSRWRGFAWISIFFFPALVDIFRLTLFPKKTTDYFSRIFLEVVKQRGGYSAAVPVQKDLVDALIKIKQDAMKDNKEASDDLLVSQAAIMVQAGFDATSSTVTFLTYELAFHPDIQERIYAEVKALKDKYGHLDSSVLLEATYMNAAIKEGLRMYPNFGWFERVSHVDYKLDDKLTIPAGTPVYINAIGAQRDPKIWPDPEKFDPERFMPENEGKHVAFLPFGDGPRVCIGKRFAEQSLRAVMSSVILNFHLRPVPGAKKPNEVEYEKNGLFLMPGEVLQLQYIPRETSLIGSL